MESVALTEWIYVTSASSTVLSNFFSLSSHVLPITSSEYWWEYISSLIFSSSIFSLLILIIDSVSVYVCKVMSVLNELLFWTLIPGIFEFPIKL